LLVTNTDPPLVNVRLFPESAHPTVKLLLTIRHPPSTNKHAFERKGSETMKHLGVLMYAHLQARVSMFSKYH